MRIAILNSDTNEVIFSPRANRHLEADLVAHFSQELPRWRWLKKRRFAHFAAEVERVAAELRAETVRL